jgi:glycosyltransferase involved in cell wall biosynthesis
MNQPLVSIILPVYNAQNHLARCVGSICAQTYRNIEIIILNDGSKDQSLPVCEEFRQKDPRILLVDKANSGVSDTRNLGLKLASGKYVEFVDSDDYLDPDFTERLVAAAEENEADFVIAPYKMVIPAGASKPEQVLDKIQDELGVMSVARPPEVREYGFLPAGVYDKDTFALRLMDKPASYFYSVLWNKLYRRDILTGNDIQFVSEMRWAEDLVFNLRYIQYAERFVAIDKPGYYYVQNPQSICHTQINAATIVQNKLQVFRYYKDLYTRLGIYEEVRPQLYKFLVDIAESTYPSGPFKKAIDEAKAYWKEHQSEKQ